MRIRDPKTGKIFGSIIAARLVYCKHDCNKCELSPEKYGEPNCDQVVLKHEVTALKIMGCEMLDDEEIKTCHTCKNEPKILSGQGCWCKRCLLQCPDDAWEPKEEEAKADSGKPTRESILEEAKRCVCGQREQDYGSPENNFKLIASLWEPYIKQRCVSEDADISIEPEDVAMLMALLKIARICSGTGTQDSFVDCCGYMACGGEIVGRNMETSKGF